MRIKINTIFYSKILTRILLTWITLSFMLSILEAYRRIQWSMFRIENENTNNPEKYRAILDIPELPLE